MRDIPLTHIPLTRELSRHDRLCRLPYYMNMHVMHVADTEEVTANITHTIRVGSSILVSS